MPHTVNRLLQKSRRVEKGGMLRWSRGEGKGKRDRARWLLSANDRQAPHDAARPVKRPHGSAVEGHNFRQRFHRPDLHAGAELLAIRAVGFDVLAGEDGVLHKIAEPHLRDSLLLAALQQPLAGRLPGQDCKCKHTGKHNRTRARTCQFIASELAGANSNASCTESLPNCGLSRSYWS